MQDGYGIYKEISGEIYLEKVNLEDARESYAIPEGCAGICENAFAGQSCLRVLKIPASLKHISEGSLSNSGSWAEIEKGFEEIEVDPRNEIYYSDGHGVYERNKDGEKLILYLAGGRSGDCKAVIPARITQIGKAAFYGKHIENVFFEKNGAAYSFPKHAFFNEELLKSFGKNGRLYDFEDYDVFLLRNHFNADRIRMICERLIQDWEITEQTRKRLFSHVEDNIEEAVKALAEENAVKELKMMAGAGFFTQDNISEIIDILNRTDRRELLTYLMDYKHENFKTAGFDFSV